MSMISEQVKKLREFSKYYSKTGFGFHRTDRILREAADTIEALSAKLSREVMEYREIGTAEECREAMEKYKAKKPLGKYTVGKFEIGECPSCNAMETSFGGYCVLCGQKLDWGDEE